MATNVQPRPAEISRPAANPERRRAARSNGFGGLIFGAIVVGLLGAGGFYIYPKLVAQEEKKDDGALTYKVQRNDILITVTEDGNVESASNVEIKCKVAGGSTILTIVEDGAAVEADQVIATLDKSNIEDQLNSQEIATEKANATAIQATEDYEASKLTVREYEEGTYIEELAIAEVDIRIAQENLRTSENIFKYTKKMVRKGFATSLQLEADQFAVERANLNLVASQTRKKVLTDFTKEKTLKGLVATRDAAEAKVRAENAAQSLEKRKLERLRKQLGNCEIIAPRAGMVVYANDASRSRFGGASAPSIEEGASVRENQTIFRIPALENMQVKLTVHESKVDQLSLGLRARITIQDQEFTGKIVSIANQPEATSFFSGNVKEYATGVAIEGSATGLRPGQTAHVEVLIAELFGVLTIPVSSVVEQRGKLYCWVKTDGKPEKRPLKLGKTNDKLVEVIDGVKEGEEVLRNPRAVVEDARKETPMDEAKRDSKDFGKTAAKSGDAPAKTTKADGKTGEKSSGRPAGEGAGSSEDQPKTGKEFIAKFDKNGDGKVQQDELDERMQRSAQYWWAATDADGDGGLDEKESKAVIDRMSRFRQGGGRPGGGSGGR